MSKLKWVGVGIIIMGFGFLVFALPHFLVGPYRAELPDNNICVNDVNFNGTSRDCSDSSHSEEDISWNVWFFFVAQLLHGMGMVAFLYELVLFKNILKVKILFKQFQRPRGRNFELQLNFLK